MRIIIIIRLILIILEHSVFRTHGPPVADTGGGQGKSVRARIRVFCYVVRSPFAVICLRKNYEAVVPGKDPMCQAFLSLRRS